jgi:spermidine synthase
MLGRPLIFEKHDDSHGSYFEIQEILCRYQSEYQEIMVFETKDHGRILYIDGQMMVTSTTQGPYNESMAQIPIHLHKNPKSVLIIGGGDGCVLNSVLKHQSIENVVLAELDGEVINATRKYFPEWNKAFDDPRVTIRVGDGTAYVRECKENFDICVIDSTDPYLEDDPEAVATPLAQPQFYEDLKGLLGAEGVGIQILGHHYFYEKILRLLLKRLRSHWNCVELALVPVPFYISGFWSLGVFSQGLLEPRKPRPCSIDDFEYYNTEVHKAAFAHPNDVKRILQSL